VETCYMCSERSTSREHIPPKCIFPEKKDLLKGYNFRKDLITVPSCDVHNSHKSKDDEYIMFCLASAMQGNEHKNRHFESKIMRAAERRPHVYASFLSNLTPVLIKDEHGNVEESAAFSVNLKRLDNAFSNIARGIFFHRFGEKWLLGTKVISNALMDVTSNNAPKVNEETQSLVNRITTFFEPFTKFGANSEIFFYRIFSNDEGNHVIEMTFYEKHVVIVLLR